MWRSNTVTAEADTIADPIGKSRRKFRKTADLIESAIDTVLQPLRT